MMAPTERPELEPAMLRRLAVEADVDPRTVRRRLIGLPIRPSMRRRVDAVLVRFGLRPGQAAEATR